MHHLVVDRSAYTGRKGFSVGIRETEKSRNSPVITYERLSKCVKLFCRDSRFDYLRQFCEGVAYKQVSFPQELDLVISL